MNKRGVLLIPFLLLGWIFAALLGGYEVGKVLDSQRTPPPNYAPVP